MGSELEELVLDGNCFGKRTLTAFKQLIESCERLKKISMKDVGGALELADTLRLTKTTIIN